MRPEVDEDGRFLGAVLIDGRGYRTIESIESFAHNDTRLVLVVRKRGHFVVQCLHRVHPAGNSLPFWDDLFPSSVVATIAEGERLAKELLGGGRLTSGWS